MIVIHGCAFIVKGMGLNCRILHDSDIVKVLEFESQRLNQAYPDEMEREFARWHSKARKESLEYYAEKGWSFIVEDPEGNILGFVLAQPLLFMSGHTQSLWVEYLASRTLEARDILVDYAYRLARDKHFQGVYFPSDDHKVMNSLARFGVKAWTQAPVFVSTSK